MAGMVRGLMGAAGRAVRRLLYRPRVLIDHVGPLSRLGSDYGGWTFVADEVLRGQTIVSAGLGEDASFDVEFAKKFGARIVIVDPTPRAIAHFAAFTARAGEPRTEGYVAGGNQPVTSYPLDDVSAAQFSLVERALWSDVATLKFYLPANPDHVSHSLTNFQNAYATDTTAIEVRSITISDLLREFGIGQLALLKLDIEGAEIAVLTDLLDDGLRPNQLLVEFDELMLRTKLALTRWRAADQRLRAAGYLCGYFDGRSCFLYALRD